MSLLVVAPEEVVDEGDKLVEDVVAPTLMATLVMHADPALPHDFTCRVWDPEGDDTLALIESAYTIVVLPLSIE